MIAPPDPTASPPVRARTKPATEDVKSYFGYLEKEMAIMGILSAFSIGALSAVLWKVAGAEDNSWFQLVHAQNKGQIIVASVFMAAAALQFYRQRSLLAYYYGEIAHARAMRRRKLSREWLEEANEWR